MSNRMHKLTSAEITILNERIRTDPEAQCTPIQWLAYVDGFWYLGQTVWTTPGNGVWGPFISREAAMMVYMNGALPDFDPHTNDN
jgi:hypothetical protein